MVGVTYIAPSRSDYGRDSGSVRAAYPEVDGQIIADALGAVCDVMALALVMGFDRPVYEDPPKAGRLPDSDLVICHLGGLGLWPSGPVKLCWLIRQSSARAEACMCVWVSHSAYT